MMVFDPNYTYEDDKVGGFDEDMDEGVWGSDFEDE